MAGKIQDRGQMSGMLASLKGAWKRVAGRKSDHRAPVEAPERVELETLFEETPDAEAHVEETPVDATVAAPESTPDYAVPDATPADTGVVEDDEDAVEAETSVEARPASPTADAAQTPAEVTAGERLLEEAPAPTEPVSEPLDVASAEAVAVVAAPKSAKPAKTVKPATTTSKATAKKEKAPAPSPFIAPAPVEGGPDASWTVAQLRALAKERGVRGYSSMSKAQLLGALNGPQA